jgi:hypothetical protein
MIVGCAHARRIYDAPKLKIFGPIVVASSIQMMHPFVGQQTAA